MRKELIRGYLKDKIPVMIAFVCSDFFVIAFYSMTATESIELVYPISLSLFIYLVYLIYEGYRYIKMYQKVRWLRNSKESRQKDHSAMERHISKTIEAVHRDYLEQIQTEEERRKEETRFLSTWVHNLKTPISVTQLLLERYERKELEKEQVISQLRQENDRTQKQLEFILELMRMNEFVKDYSPQTIDLAKEVRAVINENKRLFIYSKVYPKVVKEDEEYLILSDQKWNRAVVTQLISNAVKYSQDGTEHRVFFSLKREGEKTILSIKDEGIGIPEYDLPRVCAPFFTGDNGRGEKNSTGIGLYFCKQVLSMLGHEFSIQSKQGEGTTVTISYLTKLKG